MTPLRLRSLLYFPPSSRNNPLSRQPAHLFGREVQPIFRAGGFRPALMPLTPFLIPGTPHADHSYFSTTKLPMISASMPELKKVRMASVGEDTIGSPRKLNEVFITTGTP